MQRRKRIAFLIVSVVTLASACASVNPVTNVSKYGPADPAEEAKILERYEEAKSSDKDVSDDEVTVFLNALPKGFAGTGMTLAVEEGYDHEVIAQFSMQPNSSMGTFWFTDYRNKGLKTLCHPQVPLTWITLTMWAAVPTTYPCYGNSAADKAAYVEDIRRLAEAAGGDAAIASFMIKYGDKVDGARGFIIRLDPDVETERDGDGDDMPPSDSSPDEWL